MQNFELTNYANEAVRAFILIKTKKVDCYSDVLRCKDYEDYSTYFRLNRMEEYKTKLTEEEFLFLKDILTRKLLTHGDM